MTMLEVTREMVGTNPIHPDYPLLPGDVLVREDDGTYMKVAPGLGIGGFILDPTQVATLKPTTGHIVIGGSL